MEKEIWDAEYYRKYWHDLEAVRQRYFRSVIPEPKGRLVHTAGCDIWKAITLYGCTPCNCGLLYDLSSLPEELAERIFPEFKQDRIRAARVWDRDERGMFVDPKIEPVSEEEMKELLAGFHLVETEIEFHEDDLWEVVQSVFAHSVDSMRARFVEYAGQQKDAK